MNIIKTIIKNAKLWLIVTASVLVFLLTATLVVTQSAFLYETLNSVFGGPREKGRGDDAYYKADYKSKADVLQAANELNQKIAEEGIILLKNDNSLPLNTSDKISVFGKNSIDLVYGGSGSSTSSGGAAAGVSIYDSLAAVGFNSVNPTLKTFYSGSQSGGGRVPTPSMKDILGGYPIGESPIENYKTDITSSYAQYNDAALVVFSRICGEGYDLPRTMRQVPRGGGISYSNVEVWGNSAQPVTGARSMDDHYLQLDQNETDLLEHVCAAFDNVIVIINCSTPMELGFLDAGHYAYHPEIKGALWIGTPGRTGLYALGKVLSGEVNPSGRTVDTYARDFKTDPTWNNFGNNLQNMGNRYKLEGTSYTNPDYDPNYYFVDYAEGIYVGYRYWETRGFTDGEEWYNDNVVFPFGYGKSYTTFSWELTEWSADEDSNLVENGEITVKVKVTNTGTERSGKDVVQLYYTAPYYPGGIEKAHVVLGDFAKTPELYPLSQSNVTDKPNSAEVALTLKVRDMVSYDFSDANGNMFYGYELDAGAYTLSIGKNAHDAWAASIANPTFNRIFFVPTGGFKYTKDSATGKEIKNLFDDVSDYFYDAAADIYNLLSRSSWTDTWPSTPTVADRTVNQAFLDSLVYTLNDIPTDPWYSEVTPDYGKKLEKPVLLWQLIDEETGKADFNNPLWADLLDQLTIVEMSDLIGQGNYHTKEIPRIGKPRTHDPDGPVGFALFMGSDEVYDTCNYVGECVVAATWSKALARAMGEMIGNEGIIGNEKNDKHNSGDDRPYSGWYAPAVNIHRSQFSGRNWEYYSEDGMLSGIMAANVVAGARSKGIYPYVKHFVLNDQETNRDSRGILTWASEQSMREIYFKPFEMAVKDGGATAMMSSFNRIGKIWAGGSYALLTELLRDEWGFKGMVVTDYNLNSNGYMPPDQMIRAGGDINLVQDGQPKGTLTATQISCLRRATKNILYTVANSNAMNGVGEGLRYALPSWVIILICVDCAVAAALGVWCFFAIRKALKKEKEKT